MQALIAIPGAVAGLALAYWYGAAPGPPARHRPRLHARGLALMDPVTAGVTVELPRARAFDLFTEGLGSWWPREFSWARQSLERIGIEPRDGGLAYEVGPHGFLVNWGTVTAWEPPDRFVLAWQIAPDRSPQPDPAKSSEVEVRFADSGGGATRVDVEHRCWERHGDGGREYRDGFEQAGLAWPARARRASPRPRGAAPRLLLPSARPRRMGSDARHADQLACDPYDVAVGGAAGARARRRRLPVGAILARRGFGPWRTGAALPRRGRATRPAHAARRAGRRELICAHVRRGSRDRRLRRLRRRRRLLDRDPRADAAGARRRPGLGAAEPLRRGLRPVDSRRSSGSRRAASTCS